MAADPEQKKVLQEAVDWMFLMTLEWFGLPDAMKKHGEQIAYGMKGSTNDELRQTWMSTAVPLCEEHGIEVPAHHDAESDTWVIDAPFPTAFHEDEKRWDLDGGEVSWDDVMVRWKARGPANEELVEQIQRGYKQLARSLEEAPA
jgi:ring-1,2-phenylacetyl-CoA epoxidase subunit PaaA